MPSWMTKLAELFGHGIGTTEEVLSKEELAYRLKRAYAHECGHAAVAWLSPAVVAVHGVTFRPRGDRAAATGIALNPSHGDYHTENALICLGGLAGEVLVWGKVRSGGFGEDLPRALESLDAFLRRSTVAALERRWQSRLSESSLDVASMFARRPQAALAAALNLCYRRCKRLLQDNRAGFDRLIALAERQGDLSSEDIASQFGPRPWAPRER